MEVKVPRGEVESATSVATSADVIQTCPKGVGIRDSIQAEVLTILEANSFLSFFPRKLNSRE